MLFTIYSEELVFSFKYHGNKIFARATILLNLLVNMMRMLVT